VDLGAANSAVASPAKASIVWASSILLAFADSIALVDQNLTHWRFAADGLVLTASTTLENSTVSHPSTDSTVSVVSKALDSTRLLFRTFRRNDFIRDLHRSSNPSSLLPPSLQWSLVRAEPHTRSPSQPFRTLQPAVRRSLRRLRAAKAGKCSPITKQQMLRTRLQAISTTTLNLENLEAATRWRRLPRAISILV